MPLPTPPNTTCDIYRNTNAPPAAPDVAGVSCHLRPDWARGMEQADHNALPVGLVWTHVVLMDVAVDVRDAYQGGLGYLQEDTIFIPDQNGTPFRVTFIERVFRGAAQEHKRVYVDRQAPTWPTNEL